MCLTKVQQRTELDDAMDHYDGMGVLAYLDQQNLAACEKERGHDWMQAKFDSVQPMAQEYYVDRLIAAVRWGRVGSTTQSRWKVWLARPRTYKLTNRQLTDYHIMLQNCQNGSGWFGFMCL